MPDASRAVFGYEGAQTPFPMQVLSNPSGDNQTFEFGTSQFVSRRSGSAPEVRPDGVKTGLAVSVAVSGTDNLVDVSAGDAFVSGIDVTASASLDLAVARPTVSDFLITSITCDSAGTIAVEVGTEGASFSETRGAAGGPPLIPVGEIELGQVRYTSQVAAAVLASEIQKAPGLHRETADNPVFQNNTIVAGANANTRASAALPLIHTGGVSKQVFASWSEPQFVDVPKANAFVPADESATVNTTAIYGGSLGSVSKSLSAQTVTIFPESNIADALIALDGEVILTRYVENPDVGNAIITQGTLSFTRANPADDQVSMAVSVAAESKSVNVIA